MLGASNLTRGFSVVLESARRRFDGPVEILGAMGRGRSYGQSTELLGRRLPGILHCALWQALDRLPPSPTAALVTDIGNDILYEVPVQQLVAWLTECFDRLGALGAQAIVTELPVANLESLSPRRFLFYRRLFVPNCRLDQRQVTDRVYEVNGAVNRLASERGMSIVAQQPAWYRLDPIHIHLLQWPRAWRTILSPWRNSANEQAALATLSMSRAMQCALFFPENAVYLGVERSTPQPCARLADGTTVALY
jgi:hypothetical protein